MQKYKLFIRSVPIIGVMAHYVYSDIPPNNRFSPDLTSTGYFVGHIREENGLFRHTVNVFGYHPFFRETFEEAFADVLKFRGIEDYEITERRFEANEWLPQTTDA